MSTPTTTINALPVQDTLEPANLVIVQDGPDTKSLLMSLLLADATAKVAAHVTDTSAAHAASAISAVPSGVLNGTDVQTNLDLAGVYLTGLPSSYQPLDSDLTKIASLTPTLNSMIQADGSGQWQAVAPSAVKTSLTLTKSDVGLDQVDNTSDVNKPVSTATTAALATKVDKTLTISTVAPLAGGGPLSAPLTLVVATFTGSAAGVVPASPGGASAYLRADGQWQIPAAARKPVNPQVGTTYAPALGDENTMVTISNAAGITVTMPSDATQAFPIGAEVDWAQLGAGQITFAAGSGATVNGTPSLKLRAQYSAATTKKIATNTWLVIGDLQ